MRALALVLLAASPAAAQVGAIDCAGHSAELFDGAAGSSLVVDGTALPLDPVPDYAGPVCIERKGRTFIGFTEFMGNAYEAYRLVDPATLAMSEIAYPEAEALGWWE